MGDVAVLIEADEVAEVVMAAVEVVDLVVVGGVEEVIPMGKAHSFIPYSFVSHNQFNKNSFCIGLAWKSKSRSCAKLLRTLAVTTHSPFCYRMQGFLYVFTSM